MVGVDVIMLVDICCLQMEPFTILYPSFLPPSPTLLTQTVLQQRAISKQGRQRQAVTVAHISSNTQLSNMV